MAEKKPLCNYAGQVKELQSGDNLPAGVPTAITVANEATDTTCYPVFVTDATGNVAPKTNAGLVFNSSDGRFGATTLNAIGGTLRLAANSVLSYAGSGNHLAVTAPTDGIMFVTNSTAKAYILADGNFGIGTSSPTSYHASARKLVIADTAGSCGMTVVSKNDGYGSLFFADGSTTTQAYEGYIQYSHINNMMYFGTAHALRAVIDSTGKLGVANDTPAELLTLGTAGTTAGTLSLAGATSGKAIINVQAVAGTPTLTLPTSTGTLARTADNVASATKLETARNINGVAFDGTADILTPTTGGVTHTANADGFEEAGGTTSRKLTVSGGDVALVGGGVSQYFIVLGTDRTNNTTTVADCTGLSATLEANKTYLYKFRILYTTAAYTTGIFTAVNGPAVVTGSFNVNTLHPLARISNDAPVHMNVYNTSSDANTVGGTVTTQTGSAAGDAGMVFYTEMFGSLSTTASGTFIARFRSEVANSTVTIKAGSLLELTKVN
ncbi:MAG TPA: hypothetical protein DET40_21660 [Lentisphaeria bacterium]|nr:hypothetical protein [Lentisphaeria bacterium]